MKLKFHMLDGKRLTLLAVLVTCAAARAALPTERAPLPNFDRRTDGQTNVSAPAIAQAAKERLQSQLPQVQVDFDRVSRAPKLISARGEFLTGRDGQGKAVTSANAAKFANDPHRATKAFIQEHRELFGHGPEALDKARIKQEFVTSHNGLRTVIWEQQMDDIPLFESLFISHTTRAGELVNVASQFVPDPVAAANRGVANRAAALAKPEISAHRATVLAAQSIEAGVDESSVTAEPKTKSTGPEQRQSFQSPRFSGLAETKLIWLPMDSETLRLCWDVVVMSRARGEMFRVLVDAQSGEVLVRRGLTEYISSATYRVYTSDSPSPFSPGHPTPLTTQPPLINRTLLTLSALDTTASPNGWIDDGVNETLGNNVDAHTDLNADNVADLPRPQGSPFRVFDFPLDLAQPASSYTNAAVVQLFYWNNFMHDRLYQLGFTEAAGNFQINNFGRGGLGNDAVQADAQDGSGVNNANFSTPPDGSPGRMQMYIFSSPSPNRDGDLDAEIVLHEYTHGLSNRRVGGGVGLSALQSRGMGEGWSDFYALGLLSEATDDVNGTYAAGGYATYQLGGSAQNYYYGIRRYPYCTDMNKNPLTFKDIDPAQASSHSGVPRSPIIGTTANEVHNMGEVWCVTLHEARMSLITKYGWAVGNQLMLQLVTDGMALSPANPNFLQARDAILQADLVDTGGANRNELWAAFAKRGMGYTATSPASSTTTGLQEAFDVPDTLGITPSAGLTSAGQVGGPFSPTNQAFILLNSGSSNLNWTAWTTQPWVSVSSSGGSLAPGVTNGVVVSITAAANTLTSGTYTASVIFSNATTSVPQSRAVSLTVSPPQILFFSLDKDPGWTRQGQWAFGKPQGLGGTSFGRPDPTTGATGTNVFGVNLGGDYSTSIGGPYYLTTGPLNFTGYAGIILRFQRWLNADYPPYVYQTIEVSTNGTSWSSIFANTAGAAIADASWQSVSYDISAYASNRTNVFVRWGHQVGSGGAFPYSGWNIDDVEFLGSPVLKLTLNVPVAATEGDGTLTGSVAASAVVTNDLIVSLNSGDTTEVTVPATVTIPAGQSNVVFNLNIVDDAELDGTQSAIISATAGGYAAGIANIAVADNETATLSLSLPPTTAEGQGTVNAAVLVSTAAGTNVTVSLSSSDTSEILVPATMTIPAGQTFGVFTATVVDDNLIDGPQSVSITAHVQNWTDGVANLSVLDNEATNLTVTLPATVQEDAGVVAAAGWVRLAGLLPTNLPVALVSDAPSRMTVPPTMIIPAGQLSNTFALTLVDNAVQDGNQVVRVTASAPGFADGTNALLVLDDDLPPSFTSQPTNLVVYENMAAVFGATASGKAPLSYQWAWNGTNQIGATNSALVLTNVQLGQAGNYAVTVTNLFGGVTSSNALLTVLPSPPVPIIYSFTPLAAKAGQTLHLTGTNFSAVAASNIVYFGAVRAVVSNATPTSLDVIVPPGATYAPPSVTVAALTGQANKPFMPTFDGGGSLLATNSFAPKVDLAAGGIQQIVLIGDLDGDGKPDLVTPNDTSTFSIFRNISSSGTITTGSFAPRVDFSIGGPSYGGVLADIDGDGKLDIVMARNATGTGTTISVFRNISTPGSIGTSSFAPKVDFTVATAPIHVAAADLDGDGKLDLAVACYQGAAVSLLRNTSTPGIINTSSFAPKVDFAAGASLWDVKLADLDGDGRKDIVVTKPGSGAVSVIRNASSNGSFSFQPGADYSAGSSYDLALGDLDGDEKLDLAVALTSSAVAVLRNTSTVGTLGSNSFAAPVSFATATSTHGIAIGDLDGDGRADLATANDGGSSASVLRNTSVPGVINPNSFAAKVDFTTAATPVGIAIGDLDGDGRSDLVASMWGSSTVSILQNLIGPVLPSFTQQPASVTAVVGTSVAFTSAATGSVPLGYQWAWNGTNQIGATNSSLVLTNVQLGQAGNYAVTVTNLYGSVTSSNALLTVLPVPPVPVIFSFTPGKAKVGQTVHLTGTNFSAVAASNIVYFGAVRVAVTAASTSDLDVVVPAGVTYAPPTVTVAGFTGQAGSPFMPTFDGAGGIGTNSFAAKFDVATAAIQQGEAIADLDGDGKPDLVVANTTLSSVSVFRNISAGGTLSAASFATRVDFATGNKPYGCLVADVDGDGKLDIIAANNGNGTGNTVCVLRNTATAGSITSSSFAARVDFPVAQGPTRVAVGDLDGDGRMDIAAITAEGGGASVLRNTGNSGGIGTNSFAPYVHFLTGPNSLDIRIADLDGDGKRDLVTSSYNNGAVSILKNTSSLGSITTNSFAPKVDLSTGTGFDVVVGDLDGDGKPELVAAKNTAAAVAVFRNVSTVGVLNSNSFAAPVSFATAAGPSRVAISDLDGDGRPDLAVSCGDVSQISVLRNTGLSGIASNSFAARVDYASGPSPLTLVIDDLDGDGRPDLFAGNWGGSTAAILQNQSPLVPVFTQQPTNLTAIAGTAVTFASAATGSTPLSYQWRFNGTNISGATNSTLVMTNVQPGQAGNYAVTVTNLYGAATSSNALLVVYAHHFEWSVVPSPQTAKVPFTATLFAKDAANNLITNFAGPVAISTVVTNSVGTNMAFETGSLEPWTPLNFGAQPGPYELVPFDVNRDSAPSFAFRIAANNGAPDGIKQDVPLAGGVTYNVRMNIATDDMGGGNNADGGTTAIAIGGTNIAQFSWGAVNNGNVYRTNLAGTFTPPTNGFYPVALTFSRGYAETASLWCLADDLLITGPAAIPVSPTLISNFANGSWTGLFVLQGGGTNINLIADDGHEHTGISNPFNVTNPLPPFILVQPVGQMAIGGSNVTLNVSAGGTPPLVYAWQKNAAALPGGAGASLVLTNVSRASSGNYSVIITNIAGSIASSNALLLVRVKQLLGTPVMLPDGSVTFPSGDGDGGLLTEADLAGFEVQASENLLDWTTLVNAMSLTNGMLILHDDSATNHPLRFYRIIEH